MNLFISGCQYLWFLYILHREICLMTDNYNGIIVSRNKRQKKRLDFYFFFFFKISNGIQKHRSRQLSDGNQFKIVISSIQSPGRIKKSFVLRYKPLSSSGTSDTLRRQLGVRMGVSPMEWPCQICRAGDSLPSLLEFPSPITNSGWAWTPNDTTTARHIQLALNFSSASWKGSSLGGWAVLPSWEFDSGAGIRAWPHERMSVGTRTDIAFTLLVLFGHCFRKKGSLPRRFWMPQYVPTTQKRKDN